MGACCTDPAHSHTDPAAHPQGLGAEKDVLAAPICSEWFISRN